MALAVEKIDTSIGQTHVLIIGVGNYPFLPGGVKSSDQDSLKGLGQLKSPPISAEFFLDAVLEIDKDGGWIKPLGSVEILISAESLSFGSSRKKGTYNNIKEAYYHWFDRCNTNANNVAIFYFCGHGLEKDDHYLLAEDFGKNKHNAWEHAIAFDSTRRAFHANVAETQVFAIDACRQVTTGLLLENVIVTPFSQSKVLTRFCKYYLDLKATSYNEKAYSLPNEPSFFVRALVKALKGAAAIKEDGEWTVSTNDVSSQINKILNTMTSETDSAQRCVKYASESSNLVRLSKAPIVPVEMGCSPDHALSSAHLSYENIEIVTNQSKRLPEASNWKIELEAGIYKFEAKFMTSDEFKNGIKYLNATPPFIKERINCQ